MDAILNDLKQHIIISPEDIQSLRKLLIEQHPELNHNERAKLFAKTLHRILNEALHPFEEPFIKSLKQELLNQMLLKDKLSINAFDIFHVYTQMDALDKTHLSALTTWINHYQSNDLSIDEVTSLAHTFILHPDSTQPLTTLTNSKEELVTSTSLIHQNKKLLIISGMLVIIVSCYFSKNIPVLSLPQANTFSGIALAATSFPDYLEEKLPDNGLPSSLQYKTIDHEALKLWLEARHSLLASEPYFTTILNTAKSFNINPLLFFAVTGQEQGFVPKSHENAEKIANNPFNLYGSWRAFNTSIEESAPIAARTFINLGKDCPSHEDPIKWINRSYAEDPNWHLGVSYFLNELEEVTHLRTN